MKLKTATGIATIVAAVAGAAVFMAPPAAAQPQQQQGGQPDMQNMGQMLVDGLKATPGCLGVQTGDTESGLSFIMAWFENAEAARTWYNSPVHNGLRNMAGGDPQHKPLGHVEDEDAPVMVIASLRFTGKPEIPNLPMPINQIAIELYTPLPGGAYINGRMAPDTVEVPFMKNFNAGGKD